MLIKIRKIFETSKIFRFYLLLHIFLVQILLPQIIILKQITLITFLVTFNLQKT